jgi:hypothetical protein
LPPARGVFISGYFWATSGHGKQLGSGTDPNIWPATEASDRAISRVTIVLFSILNLLGNLTAYFWATSGQGKQLGSGTDPNIWPATDASDRAISRVTIVLFSILESPWVEFSCRRIEITAGPCGMSRTDKTISENGTNKSSALRHPRYFVFSGVVYNVRESIS